MAVDIVSSLSKLDAAQWNALRHSSFPFTRFEHLLILETTQCLGERTGWFPTYLLRFREVAGAGPRGAAKTLESASWFYQKTNSYGEFVFDHEWAELHERLGIQYYPKAVAAIPFTPATGSKLLGPEQEHQGLIEASVRAAKAQQNSSYHHLFLPAAQRRVFEAAGLALRTGVQFHWTNPGYRDFEEFLSRMKKKRRKEIRYERKNVDSDIEVRLLTGSDLSPEWADFAYLLYSKTNVEKMSYVCLTRDYFTELFDRLKSSVRFLVALRRGTGQPIAGALFLQEGASLFGRYWGSLEERRFLHFELCYYVPIELAISEGLALIEAGAQGAHKISRGFLPSFTYSAHSFFHTALHSAFCDYARLEDRAIRESLEGHTDHFPFEDENLFRDACEVAPSGVKRP